jgi:hypothetical protein
LFTGFRFVKSLLKGQFSRAYRELWEGARFAFSRYDYLQFPVIMALEEKYKVTSHYLFYAHPQTRFRNLKVWLFDPGYNVLKSNLAAILKQLVEAGHSVGLHQSFGAWKETDKMTLEKDILDQSLGFSPETLPWVLTIFVVFAAVRQFLFSLYPSLPKTRWLFLLSPRFLWILNYLATG